MKDPGYKKLSYVSLFLFYWTVLFCLYFPARNAGFVSDFTGWLHSITADSFYDYINRTHFKVKSLYQVTQFNTYILYQLFGTNRIAWHLFFVSFHAVNCLLLAAFTRKLFTDACLENANGMSFFSGLLFAMFPYVSEVIVWEPAFHYLQAVCIILLILRFTQMYLRRQQPVYIAASLGLYFVSTFTHELFYLTPWLVLLLLLCYRYALNYDKAVFIRLLKFQFTPMLLLFGLHLVIFALAYGKQVSHVGEGLLDKSWQSYAIKIPFYAFHLSVLGRIWPGDAKEHVYTFLRTPAGALLVYGVLGFITILPVLRFKKLSRYNRLLYFFWLGLIFSVLIYVPMWIPDKHIVTGDRYTYLMLVFWIPIVIMLADKFRTGLRRKPLMALIICGCGVLTYRVNQCWGKSADIVRSIQRQIKPSTGKTGLMLSIPSSLNGIPMLGSSSDGEVRLMHNLLFTPALKDSLLDVASYNMFNIKDGAHVKIQNDSTVTVSANRSGIKWTRNYVFELSDYETTYYRLHTSPAGNSYDIVLKQPLHNYVLYYQAGDTLKIADPELKGVEQY